jgi:hypothetical protein
MCACVTCEYVVSEEKLNFDTRNVDDKKILSGGKMEEEFLN